jgi:cytochrome c
VGAGEKVFGKCKACHKIDGSNGTGPHLDGVMGRAVGSVDGFGYSDGMKAHGGNWDPEALNAFLENPKGNVPGTKMSFAGLPKPEDRANLIAYLQSLGG